MIETALSQMDEVIVIIYEAREATSVPINIRVGWILPKYLEVLDKDWDEASANWVRMRW